MRGSASAPASSANLGPGFDLLAVALEPRCSVVAEPAARWSIAEYGTAYEPERDSFVRSAVAAVADGAFHLVIENSVPRTRGLGSSAAVAAAAIAAAVRASGVEPTREEIYAATAAADGHPDNAAAAVYGGLVAAVGTPHRLEVSPVVEVVVGVPELQLSTDEARAVLSGSVERGVAVRSLARLACLIEGLRLGDRDLMAGAGGDELHEGARNALSPVTSRLIAGAREAGAWHAAWSGAGPSAIAFCSGDESAEVAAAMADVLGGEGEVLRPAIDGDGLR